MVEDGAKAIRVVGAIEKRTHSNSSIGNGSRPMKRPFLSTTLIVLFLGALASTASAQMMRISAEERTQQLKDSLSLNDEQVKKVLVIYKDTDEKRKEIFATGSEDRQLRTEAMRSLAEKTDAKIEEVLTPEQKVKYKELVKQREQRRLQRMRRD